MMEDFSGLALPPLFGGHILEAELEPGGVELGSGEVIWTIISCHILNIWAQVKILIRYFCFYPTFWENLVQKVILAALERQDIWSQVFFLMIFLQVELGPGGNELLGSTVQEDEDSRALHKKKYLALSRRCKEIEQVCACVLSWAWADIFTKTKHILSLFLLST